MYGCWESGRDQTSRESLEHPPPHQINCTFTLWPNNSIPEIYYKEILTQFHKGPGQEM